MVRRRSQYVLGHEIFASTTYCSPLSGLIDEVRGVETGDGGVVVQNKLNCDIVIIGGGPGGTAATIAASKKGLQVLLLNDSRFPRPKICGDAITPFAASLLQGMGLWARIRDSADELVSQIAFSFNAEKLCRNRMQEPLIVCNRFTLDSVLFAAAADLAETREGWRVDNLVMDDRQVTGVTGHTNNGQPFHVSAKVVVGADGASSVVARRAGADKNDWWPLRDSSLFQ